MEFILIWVFFAILAAVIADKNGRSVIVWGLLGLAFGIFAVVIVAVMGKVSR